MDFHKYSEGKGYVIAYPDGYKGSFNAGQAPTEIRRIGELLFNLIWMMSDLRRPLSTMSLLGWQSIRAVYSLLVGPTGVLCRFALPVNSPTASQG